MKTITSPTPILVGTAILMMALGAPIIKADTYYYTGNDFTFVTGLYTTSDSLSGTFSVSTALGDNFYGYVSPAQFSFTDGVQTLTNNTPDIDVPTFFVATDQYGNINQWIIEFLVPTTSATIYTNGTPPIDGDSDDGSTLTQGQADNTGAPGAWTASSVPEPSGGFLMSTALLALALLARKRKAQGHRPSPQMPR
jgi:hypothetical protein